MVLAPKHKVVTVNQQVTIPSHTQQVNIPATMYVEAAHTVYVPEKVVIVEPAHTETVVVNGQDVTIQKTLDVTEASMVETDTRVTVDAAV